MSVAPEHLQRVVGCPHCGEHVEAWRAAEAAPSSLETFKRAGARVVGVVLNRIPRNRSYYYGGYKYYSPYSDNKGYYSGNGNGSKPLEQPEDLGLSHPVIEASPAPSYLARLSEKIDNYPSPDPPEE